MSNGVIVMKILDAVRGSDKVKLNDFYAHHGLSKEAHTDPMGATITIRIPDVDIGGDEAMIDIDVTDYFGEVYYNLSSCFLMQRSRDIPRGQSMAFQSLAFRVGANEQKRLHRLGVHGTRFWDDFTSDELVDDFIDYAKEMSEKYNKMKKGNEDV